MSLPPALTAQGFKTLPVLVKRSAVEAYKRDAHPLTVERAFKYAVDNPDSKRIVGLLPICFLHLDPAAIPSSDDVDRAHTPALHAISRGTSSLITLFKLGADQVASAGKLVLSHLWPRIFPWYLFVLKHWSLFHGEDDGPKLGFHADLLDFARTRAEESADTMLVLCTEGFVEQLMRIWAFYSTIDGLAIALDVLSALEFFTVEIEIEDPAVFQRVVDGAGGSIAALASVIRAGMTRILDAAEAASDDPAADAEETAELLAGVYPLVSLIVGSESSDEESRAWPQFGALPRKILFDDGIPLILRCAEFHTPGRILPLTDDHAMWRVMYPLEMCFLFLSRVLSWTHGDGCGWLEDALQHNFLRIIVRSALLVDGRDQSADKDEFIHPLLRDALRSLLHDVVPIDLLSRTAVAILEEELGVLDRESPETGYQHSEWFRDGALGDEWAQFKVLATERANILRQVEEAPGKKVCDNPECGKIVIRTETRRCAECQSVYYCSKNCQRADWRRAEGHREFCAFYKVGELCLTSHVHRPLHQTQRVYLRALLDHDYHKRWTEIHVQQIQHLLANPSGSANERECPALITIFRYTRHPVQIQISSTTAQTAGSNGYSLGKILAEEGFEWRDLVLRASASRFRGSFELHVVTMHEGGDVRYVVVPLRREHGLGRRVYDGLRDVARAILVQGRQHNIEAIREEVEKLRLQVADPETEFH
ncbi:hypothetical protein MKEN_01323700 [Mycena kentingensis (nom. inval.)]|nr:hypothetical protein MKEN_01323700 [Mycena kentingensis (nom. inval.)]